VQGRSNTKRRRRTTTEETFLLANGVSVFVENRTTEAFSGARRSARATRAGRCGRLGGGPSRETRAGRVLVDLRLTTILRAGPPRRVNLAVRVVVVEDGRTGRRRTIAQRNVGRERRSTRVVFEIALSLACAARAGGFALGG
jgi:hypothetical protein